MLSGSNGVDVEVPLVPEGSETLDVVLGELSLTKDVEDAAVPDVVPAAVPDVVPEVEPDVVGSPVEIASSVTVLTGVLVTVGSIVTVLSCVLEMVVVLDMEVEFVYVVVPLGTKGENGLLE